MCVCVFFLKNGLCHKENNFPRQKRLSVQNLPTLGLFYLSTPPGDEEHRALSSMSTRCPSRNSRCPSPPMSPAASPTPGMTPRMTPTRMTPQVGSNGSINLSSFPSFKKKTGFDCWLMDPFFLWVFDFFFSEGRKERLS